MRAKLPAALSDHKIVIAEAAEPMLPAAGYRDLLTFENDIAGAVALILLFSESPGSLAELGAFSAIESVASKLLVIIDDGYYNESSFIRNGPIAALENNQGDECVLVLERSHVGISDDRDINLLNYDNFTEAVMPVVEQRFNNKQNWEKFNSNSDGHFILLITGLVQICGALTITEIKECLEFIGYSKSQGRIYNYLYCSELMGWVKKEKKGNHTFYASRKGDDALDFILNPSSTIKEKVRWKATFRSYWQATDKPRFRAISEAAVEL